MRPSSVGRDVFLSIQKITECSQGIVSLLAELAGFSKLQTRRIEYSGSREFPLRF